MVPIIVIFFPLLLFITGITPIHSAMAEVAAEVEAANSGTSTLSISISNGLLSIEAEGVPLESVLEELSQKTETTFALRDPSFSKELLSVSFREMEFSEAIGRVLRNFSYVMETGDDQKPVITILGAKGSGEIYSSDAEREKLISKGHKEGTDARPETLDECQRLSFSREDVAKQTRGLSPQKEKQLIRDHERDLTDARIERAQGVLGMQKCSHLWQHAIQEIQSIQDDRVTALLTGLAEQGDPQIRGLATKTLWYNIASSAFKNTEGLSALKRLTGSSDQNVSMFAKEALQDYERQMKKTK